MPSDSFDVYGKLIKSFDNEVLYNDSSAKFLDISTDYTHTKCVTYWSNYKIDWDPTHEASNTKKKLILPIK